MNREYGYEEGMPSSLEAYRNLEDEDLLYRYQQRGDQGAMYCLFGRYAHIAYGCFAMDGRDARACSEQVESLFMRLICGEKLEEKRFRDWLLDQCLPARLRAGEGQPMPDEGAIWARFTQGKVDFSSLAEQWDCPWEEVAPRLEAIAERQRLQGREQRF